MCIRDSYEHWDAHIDLYLRMLEFDDAEDMAFVKDIGEKAHYLCTVSYTHLESDCGSPVRLS